MERPVFLAAAGDREQLSERVRDLASASGAQPRWARPAVPRYEREFTFDTMWTHPRAPAESSHDHGHRPISPGHADTVG